MIKYISIENYFINRNNDKNIFIIDNNVFKNWTNKINNITGKSKYYLLESTEFCKFVTSEIRSLFAESAETITLFPS